MPRIITVVTVSGTPRRWRISFSRIVIELFFDDGVRREGGLNEDLNVAKLPKPANGRSTHVCLNALRLQSPVISAVTRKFRLCPLPRPIQIKGNSQRDEAQAG